MRTTGGRFAREAAESWLSEMLFVVPGGPVEIWLRERLNIALDERRAFTARGVRGKRGGREGAHAR